MLASISTNRYFGSHNIMINWTYFPQSKQATPMARKVVNVFEAISDSIDSQTNNGLVSNDVLHLSANGLESIGFKVERGKKKADKINIPVLFGRNGKVEKSFEADALNEDEKFVIEVEAGRAVTNYQFLKDLFQATMMNDVDYLCIAVRNVYRNSKDFERVFAFFDTLYKSNRVTLPLKGILIIGY
jgi:hypothetical protein